MKLLVSFLLVCCAVALASSTEVEPQQPNAEATTADSPDTARDKRGVTVSVDSPATVSVATPGVVPVYPGYPYYYYPYYPYYPYTYVAGK